MISTLRVVVGLLALGLSLVSAAEARPSGQLPYEVALPDANSRLEGSFRQEKTLQDLGATLESSGDFLFSVAHGLRWNVRQPIVTTLRITRVEIIELQDGKEVMRMATEDQPITRVISEVFFTIFTGDQGALEEHFSLRQSGTPGNWTLELSPIDEAVGSVIESVELRGGNSVDQVTLQETNGDLTRIFLDDVRLVQP